MPIALNWVEGDSSPGEMGWRLCDWLKMLWCCEMAGGSEGTVRGGNAARGYEVPQPAAAGELRGVNEPGAENPRARPPRKLGLLGTERGTGPGPMAERGGGMVGDSCVSRFLGFGRRGGTRRLKLATTSGGEWRLRVGCAGGCVRRRQGLGRCGGDLHHVLASGSSMAGSTLRRFTLRMKP